MSGKVVDLDPTKRISKEALTMIHKMVAKLTIDNVKSLTVICTPIDGPPSIHVYGLDFESLGMLQAFINVTGQELLASDFQDLT